MQEDGSRRGQAPQIMPRGQLPVRLGLKNLSTRVVCTLHTRILLENDHLLTGFWEEKMSGPRYRDSDVCSSGETNKNSMSESYGCSGSNPCHTPICPSGRLVPATWVICSQNRRLQNDLTSDKHPRKPTHNVSKNRKDAREFRS